MNNFDVVVLSDFRLPGGTNHSTAQELAIQKSANISTGLFQLNSRLASRPIAWSEVITSQLCRGFVEPLRAGVPTKASLALIRHPIAAESLPDLSNILKVDVAVLIANQPALKADGNAEYDPVKIDQIVHDGLGVRPIWAPIGPVVRRSLNEASGNITVSDKNWVNVFARPLEPLTRREYNRSRPTIGRHSRPQSAKWPSSRSDILSAYPDSGSYVVEVLGGAKPAIDILGYQPPNWVVHEFGSVAPEEFLERIDFWVYFHHPLWSEAYGRAIMEALWAGCVVILPRHFEETYGDAAVYCSPSEVVMVVQEFQDGSRDYHRQSEIGQRFARGHSGQIHLDRIKAFIPASYSNGCYPENYDTALPPMDLAVNNKQQLLTRVQDHAGPPRRYRRDQRPRALFITSNGAGMGHLTRLLGLARHASGFLDPVFFSMSKAVEVVGAAGFAYEYVPFNSAMQTKSALWHKYFADRLNAAIRFYRAQIVVFDGTWPYRGLIEAMTDSSVLKVWVRRGMWKSHISASQLLKADYFDLVIEPGEFAESFDEGATSQVDNATVVDPMTVLSSDELLSREDALEELGLPGGDSRYALVTLGAGNINDISSVVTTVLDSIVNRTEHRAVVTKVPIAETAVSTDSLRLLTTFPLARYTRAFDFAVSAAGYNSHAEWLVGQLPTLWIPNLDTMTDDQDARARWAAGAGVGLRSLGDDSASIESNIEILGDADGVTHMIEKMKLLNRGNGSVQAANLIEAAWESFLRPGGLANGK